MNEERYLNTNPNEISKLQDLNENLDIKKELKVNESEKKGENQTDEFKNFIEKVSKLIL